MNRGLRSIFIVLGGLFFLGFTFGQLQAHAASNDGDEPRAEELRNRFKGDDFSLGILLQTQGFYSFADNDFNGGRSWDLGSTRIDLRGTVDRNFTYRVRVYFLSQQQNIDARVGWRYSDNFEIIAGAFKPYTSRELDPSPGRIDFVRRARLVSAMMNTLETGVSALGQYGGLKYRIGIYNGDGVSGIASQNDNRFLYTARLSYDFEPLDGLSFETGVNGALNRSRQESVGNSGLTSLGDRILYGAYLKFDTDMFFGTAEYMKTHFDTVEFDNLTETITGGYATAGLRINEKNEVLGRWDFLEYDLSGRHSDMLVLGWNYYPTSVISFRLNVLTMLNGERQGQTGASGVFQFFF